MDCSDCEDFPARYRASCLRYCRQHNAGCHRMCCK
jgi:hypothetical protein